ncbi:MAG: LytTR family transcriptional regulator DNA-binding domain-containing protein [Saprospiraceae bacterium]|nr:LytTR family transcriptional regulator DNA-binding domain-containing protein [Saprospiraceae bacterium]
MVNLKHIKKINRMDGWEIIMDNGRSLPVARAKKVNLMEIISKI